MLFGIAWLASGCSSAESPTDAENAAETDSAGSSALAADFARRVRGNGYASAPDLVVGAVIWNFTGANRVSASSVEGRVGAEWLMVTYMGTYSLTGDEWPLTMHCRFVRKLIWWTGGSTVPDAEIAWDEALSARVQFSGDALMVNGVRYGKIPA